MNDDCTTNQATSAKGTRRSQRLTGLLLATGMVIASSCSLPFADAGEDISAKVDVGGAEPAGSVNNASAIDDPDEGADRSQLGDAGAQVDEVGSSEGTTSPATEQTPEQPTPTATVDTRFNGRSMQYLGIDLALGDFITTNQSLEEYLGSLPPSDDASVLLIEVSITNRSSGTISVPSDVLGLRLPSGEWVPLNEMRETDGDSVWTVQPATQATERVVLEFPDVDIAGANFEISEASTIAESIPLTAETTASSDNTIELPGQPLVAGLESPSPWPSCGYAWSGEVLSGRISVEGVDGRRLERAIKGQRWVAIEIRATYDATAAIGSSPCDDYGIAVSEIDPRLVVDGVAESSLNSVSGDRLATGTAVTTEFWFQIPVDAKEIELTDVDGTRIAIWNLNLPLLDGEA